MADRFSFANLDHLKVFMAVLAHTGAMCPKCGFATRRTSKNWAKCKKCGERVARLELPSTSQRE